MPGDLDITLDDESVQLLPERAAFVVQHRTVLVADLHLGKAETYRSLGVPMPEGIAEESLERLESVIRRIEAERVVVLGDLVHCEEGMEDPIIELVERWRRRVTLPISLVGGNHDAEVSIPRSCQSQPCRQPVTPTLPSDMSRPSVAPPRHPALGGLATLYSSMRKNCTV